MLTTITNKSLAEFAKNIKTIEDAKELAKLLENRERYWYNPGNKKKKPVTKAIENLINELKPFQFFTNGNENFSKNIIKILLPYSSDLHKTYGIFDEEGRFFPTKTSLLAYQKAKAKIKKIQNKNTK